MDGACLTWGGTRYENVEQTNVTCRVLPCIECRGPRIFLRKVPCIKYTGHYFLSTLLYSIFLGVLAVDRFCLGYSAIAVGKLMTLGGLGLWWIVDIFLLITGSLMPADGSNWQPYY
uniref:TM2 domain-containing protein n=1 Tax=Setaria digitata TaxID=48799 RepID=A0A915PST2_9BILA